MENQLAIHADNPFITLKSMNDVNTIAENHYLKMNGLPDKTEEFYLRRSKNYRIVGWSTLGGGLLLSGIGLLVGTTSTNYDNSNTAGVLLVAGAVSGIVSIPFMIMATVYKHKARAMVGTQKAGFGVPPGVSKDVTGITFSISLGK